MSAAPRPGYLFRPPGELSRSGVLDVGLRCAHSCRFCYYSFMAENAGQFDALRRASFRSSEDCLAIVDRMADFGLINFDITGGEPAMHEGLPDMVRRASRRGLSVRVITLGQFLLRPGGGRERLLDALLKAGVTDFLFSLHSAGEEGFREATRGSLQTVLDTMEALDAIGFQYSANTVIHAGNVAELPRIAELSASRGVYHHNFIVFNAYYRWDSPASIADLQASFPDIAGPLTRAVAVLYEAGVAVTVRYLPLCAAPGLERHVVGVVGVHHDPHEWMNRAGNPERPPGYCAEPLPVPLDGPRDVYALRFGPRRLDFGAEGAVSAVAVRGDDFKVFPPLCRDCAAMPYCDGLDPKYVVLHGLAGLAPFARMPGSPPLTLARRAYLPAFALKRAPLADMRGAIARVLGRRPLALDPLVTALVDAGEGAATTLEALRSQTCGAAEILACAAAASPGRARNTAARNARGAVLAFFQAGDLPAPELLARSVDFLAGHPELSLANIGGGTADFQALLSGDSASSALVVRREAFDAVGGFQDGLGECLGWDFRLAAAAAGHFGDSVDASLLRSSKPGRVDVRHHEFPLVIARNADIFPRGAAPARR